MDPIEKASGTVLMVGLPTTELDRATREHLSCLRPGGVILFGRNLHTPEQTAKLISDARELCLDPPLIALDQEGGRVSRLEPWIGATPTAVELTAAGPDATRRFGERTADALTALGFNVDFAPVVDICPAEATNGIGDRSFATDPDRVARLARAFLEGLQQRGVAGCLKHFPGLGPTAVDSHETLPISTRTREELLAIDIKPFRALSSCTAMVMVGHAHYPALEAERDLPATLSRDIVRGLLHRDLGFEGLVVTDDLEMGAVAPLDVDGAAAVRAIEAGCELLLYCASPSRAKQAHTALIGRARSDESFANQLLQAASKVEASAQRWNSPRSQVSWQQAAANFAGRSEA